MQLKTKRLLLRPIHITDVDRFYAYRSDVLTNQYQGWIPKNKKEANDFIAKTASIINQSGTWFQLVLMEKESNTLIGDVGIHFIDYRQVELGCTLDKKHQGKGYATEALRKVIDYLFNDLKKHRITTSIDPANASSIQLVERLDFRKEAYFVESLYLNGQWCDDVVYALLKREWK